jgi:hypothetical protein
MEEEYLDMKMRGDGMHPNDGNGASKTWGGPDSGVFVRPFAKANNND